MAIVDRLLRWLEIPINLLLWVALIAGFLMMMHVGADVTGRTVFNRPLHGTTEIVSAWYMVAICYLPWAWIERRDNHIVAGMFENIGLGAVLVLARRRRQDRHLRLLRGVLLADLGPCGAADVGAGRPARCGRRPAASSPCGRAAGCCRSPPGLMAVYLVLRVVRDIGRGHQPERDAGAGGRL